ncbi:MAG: SNF2 helicase associated domain-containing protein [Lachnospiraceae bacterium]|nr:SNF2 helicase associated domain-containing protein [Lachnospiraceae bacterium]
MNWRYYFTDAIIQRGESYYKKGKVTDFRKVDCDYFATVMGTLPYNVAIWKKANGQFGMSCDCMYAYEGNKCKHMAAVFVKIEKEGREYELQELQKKAAKNPNLQVTPFISRNVPGAENYTCFDLATITENVKIMSKEFKEAQNLVKKNSVRLQSVRTGFTCDHYGESMPVMDVEGYYEDKEKTYLIEMRLGTDEIIDTSCRVIGCTNFFYNSYYGYNVKLCKHQIATLLLLEGFIDKYNPGDTTDMKAFDLIEDYQMLHKGDLQKKGNIVEFDLKIEARMESTEYGIEVSFKTGTQKLYIVKELSTFIWNVESGEKQKFGSKAEIDFGKHQVCEESKSYFDFINKIITDEELRYERNDYYPAEYTVKNKILLYGSRLDEFFDIVKNNKKTIAYREYGKKERELVFEEKNPDLKLVINSEYDNELFKGITVFCELPEIIKGEKYLYWLEDSGLYRMEEENAKFIMPLLNRSYGGELEFRIGRKSLVDFYYHTLPILSENICVIDNASEVVENYLPPKAGFRFYLDSEKGELLCNAKAVYGEEEFSLMDIGSYDYSLDSKRDVYSERIVLDKVLQYCPSEDDKRNVFVCEGDDNVCEMLENGIDELMTYGEVLCTDNVKRINIRKYTKVTVGVSLESGIMELDISSDDLSQKELLDLLASYRRKKKYHRLTNGNFVNTDDENLEILSNVIDNLHITDKEILKGKIKLPGYRALYLDKILEKKENLYVERDKHFKNLIKEFKTMEDSDFEAPTSLNKILRPYQLTGFKWLKTLDNYGFGGILADDMGLGKTLQVITVLLHSKEEKKEGTSLIIAPASLIYNWREEFLRFAPVLKTEVISGGQVERKNIIEHYEDYDVLITSYDLLKRDIAEYEDKKFLYQIIDEAQYIKNHTTVAAKTVKCIQSVTKYALTGTPIENRLSELWSIFDYLMPGFLYGYETFRKELETPIMKVKDEDAMLRLKRMVSPFIIRRLKYDVLKELPEKLEEIQYTVFDEKQQHLYDAQVVHMREILSRQSDEEFLQKKLQILAELTKLREICCDPSLLYENYDGESAKRSMCVDLVKRAIEGEHRILIFSQFTSMLSMLEKDLMSEGIEFYKITGATKKEERINLVKKFNEGNIPVFLISLKAGGTGLNLTGADMVIHYDPWWNQAAQNQATDRAHRIGQKKVVTVYKLIVKNSIEEKIVKMQDMKKNLADEILSGENGNLTSMTKDELMELLG